MNSPGSEGPPRPAASQSSVAGCLLTHANRCLVAQDATLSTSASGKRCPLLALRTSPHHPSVIAFMATSLDGG
eukprot:2888-Prorocentrum_lima.AAC.1